MNTGLQTTLCPSCSRNTPRETHVCVFCGCATSTSTFAEIAETPEAPIWHPWVVIYTEQGSVPYVLDKIEMDTRRELTATRDN